VSVLNAIVQGIFLGGLYALFACGLSLMFGVLRIINLAHGDIAVLSAFLVWYIATQTGMSPFLALLIALPVMLVVGYALQVTLLARSLRSGALTPLLTTFGLAIVIQNALLQTFSPDVRSLGADAGSVSIRSWHVGALAIPYLGVLVLVLAVTVLGGLHLVLRRTAFGREMRATAEDPDTAGLVGIPASAVYARATALAVGTATLAGTFLAIHSSFSPSSGPTQLIFAFEAVVIGGIGSLWGTLIGGIVLGVAQTLGALIDPQYFILAGHLVFLAVLLVMVSSPGQLLWRRAGVIGGRSSDHSGQ
jgi:branched-chain amino acid transport system permease protein